jgi:hypothetical protein
MYVDCALPRSGTRRHALAQIIDNARGLDINSPMSAEAHTQDLRFHRHQQHGDPNNAQGLDINSPLSAENHPQDLRFHRHRQRDDPKQRSGARQQPRLRS